MASRKCGPCSSPCSRRSRASRDSEPWSLSLKRPLWQENSKSPVRSAKTATLQARNNGLEVIKSFSRVQRSGQIRQGGIDVVEAIYAGTDNRLPFFGRNYEPR